MKQHREARKTARKRATRPRGEGTRELMPKRNHRTIDQLTNRRGTGIIRRAVARSEKKLPGGPYESTATEQQSGR
jgi:hypothetical protein